MPSSIINSDDGVISGTSGLKSSGGDDGVLVFQSKGTETARVNTDKQIVAAAGTASLPIYSTTGDLNTGIYFPAADNIGFATGGTIRGRWTTDGLCFGTDTAAANALDDYEEGTWTPTDASGTGLTFTIGSGTSRYVKIGSMVFLCTEIVWPSTASANNVDIGGLPFTAAASPNQGAWGGFIRFNDSNIGFFSVANLPNTTSVVLRTLTGGNPTNAQFSTKRLDFVLVYQAA